MGSLTLVCGGSWLSWVRAKLTPLDGTAGVDVVPTERTGKADVDVEEEEEEKKKAKGTEAGSGSQIL